jgi:membrane protein
MDWRGTWRVGLAAVRAWSEDYAPSMGAALSYYALFSIAPLLLIVIGVAGFFFGEEAARGEIYSQLAALIGADGAHAVQGLVAAARRPQSGVLAVVIGAALLIGGASSVFGELQNALDRIWRAPVEEQSRRWWNILRKRLLPYGMVLGIAFLLMVSLVLSAMVAALGRWWGLHLIDIALSFALMTVLFAMIYKVVPRVQIAWRDVWVGAAVTAALFAVGKWAIGLYIGKSSIASAFGAAGSLVVLMVWVYYSAQIFLFGAEFTRLYTEARGSRAPAVAPAPRRIRVRAAANSPVASPARPGAALAKLGAALALGVGANIGLRLWRRR